MGRIYQQGREFVVLRSISRTCDFLDDMPFINRLLHVEGVRRWVSIEDTLTHHVYSAVQYGDNSLEFL